MMNNVYGGHHHQQREFYTPSNVNNLSCYDNKAMTPTALPVGAGVQQVRVNITDTDKNIPAATSLSSKIRFRKKIRPTWIINALLTTSVGALLVLLEYNFIPGNELGFFCNDPKYSYKYKGDTVTVTWLLVGTFLWPVLTLALTEYLRKGSLSFTRERWGESWFFYKEYLVGSALVLTIVEIGKVTVGEPRPNFFDVCAPDTNKHCLNGTFVESFKCTSTQYSQYLIGDSTRSFPSGHSALSVFLALFCSYIIHRRLPTVKTGYLFKPFLICLLITWGVVCSLTRITDRRHHWWDVLAGTVLGVAGAFYSISLIRRKMHDPDLIPRVSTSTTTLLDVKNKDAKSEII